MSLHRQDAAPESTPRTALGVFVAAYLALALLPLVDIVAPDLAFRVDSVVGGVPLLDLLGRQWAWIVLAMVVLGGGYASLRRVRLAAGLPRRDASPMVAGAVLTGLLIVGVLLVVVNVVLGQSLSDVADVGYRPALPVGFVWWNVVVPGLLGGIAYGVLFTGAIQSDLRRHVGARLTVLAIATVAGLYHWLVDPLTTLARSNLLLVAALVPLVGTGYAVVSLAQLEDDTSLRAALTPSRVLALVLAGIMGFLLAVDVLSGHLTMAELSLAAAWVAVFGLAAAARERADSLWAGALVVSVCWLAIWLSPYLEAALGLGAAA